MKTLGGSTFIWNGVKQDYNFIETLNCLYELCDEIAVIHGGEDDTTKKFNEWCDSKDWVEDSKDIQAANITLKEWDEQKGREKLSYFSNLAMDMLSTDWNFYLQGDEILHEDSFPNIRSAIEYDDVEAYIVSRYNLWRDPGMMLNVTQNRKPCSSEVIRLAKSKYRAFDDAESLQVPSASIYGQIDTIEIFHMGFVRNPEKHMVKIENMLCNVFGWEMDKKLIGLKKFDPKIFFNDDDLIPTPKLLPKFIQSWAKDRYPLLEFK